MPAAKLNDLLARVECEDLYDFLKLDRTATPAELSAAAQQKFDKIQNMGRRGGKWDDQKELAGLCRSKFKNDRTKKEYDRELDDAAARTTRGERPESTHEFDEKKILLNKGWDRVGLGHVDDALVIAKRLTGDHPSYFSYRLTVAELLINREKYQEALDFLGWCEDEEPRSDRYKAMLGIVYAKAGTVTWGRRDGQVCATSVEHVDDAERCLDQARAYSAAVAESDGKLSREIGMLEEHLRVATQRGWNGNVPALVGAVLIGMVYIGGAGSPPFAESPDGLVATLGGIGLLMWLSAGVYFVSSWDPQWKINADQLNPGPGCLVSLLTAAFMLPFIPFVALWKFFTNFWPTHKNTISDLLATGSWRSVLRVPFPAWPVRAGVIAMIVLLGVVEQAGGCLYWTRSEPEPSPGGVTAEDCEDALGLSESARRRIQSGLAIAGFDPGPVDGVFGSRTRQAITQWQRQVGVSPTGCLTDNGAALLEALAEETGIAGSTEGVDPSPALGLVGRWFGRIEGSDRRYYADIIFEEGGEARIRYPLSGCTGRLSVISGSSYREELTQGDECPVTGRVTLRRLTKERVSYEWGYDSLSVEASGHLLQVATMADAGDESELSGTWSGEHGSTRHPSVTFTADLTIEATGVVLRISWPCAFRLEPVSADSRALVYSAVHLEGLCYDDRVVLRRLGKNALWFETETARVQYFGTMVGILHRGFD